MIGAHPNAGLSPEQLGELERRLIEHVLPECGPRSSELRAKLDALVAGRVVPEDRRWLDLYVTACQIRRQLRLRPLLEKTSQVMINANSWT